MNSRELFEYWVANELGHTVEYIKGHRAVTIDRYFNEYIEIPYRAWKASRAAIEVELPEKVMVDDEYDRGHNYGIKYCEESVRAAGISIKGESS